MPQCAGPRHAVLLTRCNLKRQLYGSFECQACRVLFARQELSRLPDILAVPQPGTSHAGIMAQQSLFAGFPLI